MKRLSIALAMCAALAGCGDGNCHLEPSNYGLLNKDEAYDPAVKYKLDPVAVVVGIILVETIFVPVWLIGFELYEPVDAKRVCR